MIPTQYYLVYTEWDNGRGNDRESFVKRKDALRYAEDTWQDPDDKLDAIYVEFVPDGFNRDNRYDVEIGINTIAILD